LSEPKRGLGRGLSALLGEDAAAAVSGEGGSAPVAGARTAPIEHLHPNPDQPRRRFTEELLTELADSIRERGVLQPILVRPHPDKPGQFQIIAGERRWRASQKARLAEVPVVVREMDDRTVYEVAVVENVQRADLTPLEEAQAYGNLIEAYGRTQDEVAAIVGKSRSHVANTLRLRSLPEEVKWFLRHDKITAGHARALIGLPAREGEAIAKKAEAEGLNVRQVEVLARQVARGPAPERSKTGGGSASGSADVAALEQDLSDALGSPVSLKDKGGKGELVLRYATLEQLDDLCRRLMRG